LGSLELQLRNLSALMKHSEPIVERLRPQCPEVVTPIQTQLLDCDLESLIGNVQRLRAALAAERR
jgi:hypothetical protein